jgi:hypothetical protein
MADGFSGAASGPKTGASQCRLAETYAEATHDKELAKAVANLMGRLKKIFAEKEYLDEEKTSFTEWSNPSEAVRLQAMAVDLRRATVTAAGLERRRFPVFKAALFHNPRRLIVGLGLPWLGERWLTIPLQKPTASWALVQLLHQASSTHPLEATAGR